ncbi:hypothetical protein ACFYPC_36715 [Streptomyces sp. NPDC005808]|uniref:hypothetical protein n=1 Tax=Streptomyces sp. NPDC005808 TaxID=3364734 RepID=UPI00369205DA
MSEHPTAAPEATGDRTANPTEKFLGFPPSPQATELMGRVTWMARHDPGIWTHGQLTLPSGVTVDWIAHSATVAPILHLFQPSVRVVVTGHNVGGPTYLTGIRAATDAEWRGAVAFLAALPRPDATASM